jgi:hypothetical protein
MLVSLTNERQSGFTNQRNLSRIAEGGAAGNVAPTALVARPLPGKPRILQHSRWDAVLIGLAFVHGYLLLTVPSIPLIALGLWWNANTISHYFIHLPFFRSRSWNAAFSAYLTVVLGVPQTLWHQRHLAHHANRPWHGRPSRTLILELLLIAGLWSALLIAAPLFFLAVYWPGILLGLGLCQLQGFYEHVDGTISHHGALYNFLFFNDGYHVEHHCRPCEHWRKLPARVASNARVSRWPALFRWIERLNLDSLEGLVLRSTRLQRFVLKNHERAFRQLLPKLAGVRTIGIIGGGIFPRTALILKRLLPNAQMTIFEANADNIRTARNFVGADIRFVHEFFKATLPDNIDLMVVPLAFIGDRARIYRRPPAPAVLVHDWIWRRRGTSVVISVPLLKRLNLIQQ